MAKKKANILIVDDNEGILNSLKFTLKHEFTNIESLRSPNLLLEFVRNQPVDIIILDMNFKAGINTGNEGLYWLRELMKQDPNAIVILITAYGDIKLAVEAIKEGATDFITKPWDNQKLISTLNAALKLRRSKLEVNRLKNQQQVLTEDKNRAFPDILGVSKEIEEVKKIISKVALTDANVLITGENGTGKELVARELHRQSLRNEEIFVSVDLGALPETLFESELFGHTKGAYTDAKEDRIGRFETASGGSLFLDEIGNLSFPLQAKLLSALQKREIVPLGASTPVPVDIRLIAATNRNLHQMVQDEEFREDLLYRLNTIHIKLPPLRSRPDDVVLLAEHFMKQYTKKYKKPGMSISKKALDKLQKYNWPGNVRELDHAVEKAIILAADSTLQPDDFMLSSHATSIQRQAEESLNLDIVEKATISRALGKCKGNLSQTAKELGITRKTLYKKIEKYEL